MQSLNRF